jgi:hypothetical protein
MTRILFTYANVAERKVVARRASRLAARGFDVDLATATAAAALPAAAYDRVLDATSWEPLPPAPADHEGILYIAGAGLDRVPRARAPAPVRAKSSAVDRLAAVVVGLVATAALWAVGLPLFYPIGLGVLVALATLAVLRELHPPPTVADAPGGSNPLARCG